MITKRITKGGQVRYDARLRDASGKLYGQTFRTRKLAGEWEREELRRRDLGEWVDPRSRKRTLADVADEWLESSPGKAARTRAEDRGALERHVHPTLGGRQVGSIGPADLQRLVATWTAEGLAPRTVARRFGVLRAVLRYAVNAGYLTVDPVRGIRLPQAEPTRVHVFTADELARLAGATAAMWAPTVWLGAVLGLRWGEVAGLRVGALDILGRTVTIDQAVGRDAGGAPILKAPKSNAGRRTLALPAPLADLLAAHLHAIGATAATPERLLFARAAPPARAEGAGTPPPSERGGTGSPPAYSWWRSHVWIPATVAAGLGQLEDQPGKRWPRYTGPGFHDLRRTSATALLAGGVDVKTAQHRLGHSSARLTLEVYAQAVTAAERAAGDALAGLLMGSDAKVPRTQPPGPVPIGDGDTPATSGRVVRVRGSLP